MAWTQGDASTHEEGGDEDPYARSPAKEIRCRIGKDAAKESTSLEQRNNVG